MRNTTQYDALIISGFQRFDPKITKEYFYGYCRNAYNIFDYKYQLRGKVGLDFYSLAHEYYIQLLQHGFRQLTDRPEGTPLATWMTGGFRYVVLEALKAYNTEFEALVDAPADEVVEYVRSAETDEGFLTNVADAVCRYYQDSAMQKIANMVLVEGYKQKEVAEHLGITPAAVNQRYKKMMDEVVTPFVMANYGKGIAVGEAPMYGMSAEATPICPAPRPTVPAPMPSRPAPGHAAPAPTSDSRAERMRMMMRELQSAQKSDTARRPERIFVFSSNLQGIHVGSSARYACTMYGAIMGKGVGLQGQSYAIPTMQGGVETIRPYVDEFIDFAKAHPDLLFQVTPIGCEISGFEPEDIAPLFVAAKDVQNISLPGSFLAVLR